MPEHCRRSRQSPENGRLGNPGTRDGISARRPGLRRAPFQRGAVEHAVDVGVAVFGTETLGDLDGLVEHHPVRHVQPVQQLVGGQPQVEAAARALRDSLGELAQHPGIRRALLMTAEGQLTPLFWNPDGQLWVARIKARTPAPELTFEGRQNLVRELQATVSQRLLSAELQALEAEGVKRPGLSSFRGRLNGIWINPAFEQPGLPQ